MESIVHRIRNTPYRTDPQKPDEVVLVAPDLASHNVLRVATAAADAGVPLRIAGWWWPTERRGDRHAVLEEFERGIVAVADAVGGLTEAVREEAEPTCVTGLPWDASVAGSFRQAGTRREPVVICTGAEARDVALFDKIARAFRSSPPPLRAWRWKWLTDDRTLAERLAGEIPKDSPVEIAFRPPSAYFHDLATASVWWQASGVERKWDYAPLEALVLGLRIVAPDQPPWKELCDEQGVFYRPEENAGGLEALRRVLADGSGGTSWRCRRRDWIGPLLDPLLGGDREPEGSGAGPDDGDADLQRRAGERDGDGREDSA